MITNPLKSSHGNSQITNVCNDGEDNDPESLGKGHLSLTCKIHNEIDTRIGGCLKARIQTLISNRLNEASLNDWYIHLMENDTIYIHIYMSLLPFFSHFFFHFILLLFFYFHILWISINEFIWEYIMKWIYSQTMMLANSLWQDDLLN